MPGVTLLVKSSDASHANPVKEFRGCYKAGDVVNVRETGSSWGTQECNTGKFYRIAVPDMPMDSAKLLLQSEYQEGVPVKRRQWSINLSALPSRCREACEQGHIGELSWKLLAPLCRDFSSQSEFSPVIATAMLVSGGLANRASIPENLKHRTLSLQNGITRRAALQSLGKLSLALWVGSVLESIGYRYIAGPSIAHAAQRSRTIQTSGGDYTTLSAGEAAEQADLVAAGDYITFTCYNVDDTTAVTFDGWTTGSSNYIEVIASASHGGTWNTGVYTLITSAGPSLALLEDYMRITGIQVQRNANAGTNNSVVQLNMGGGTSSAVRISKCIVRGNGGGTTANYGGGIQAESNIRPMLYIWNNLIYDIDDNATANSGRAGGIDLQSFDTGREYVYNNTIVSCSNGINNRYGTGFIAKNNLIYNCEQAGRGTFEAGTNYNSTNNASMEYTVTGGGNANDRTSQTFSFVDSGSDDFHLQSGDTGAKDVGTDLSGDSNLPFSDDIDGHARSGSWDIGADEYVSTSPTEYFRRRLQ